MGLAIGAVLSVGGLALVNAGMLPVPDRAQPALVTRGDGGTSALGADALSDHPALPRDENLIAKLKGDIALADTHGLDLSAAKALLASQGMAATVSERVASAEIPEDAVVSQAPAAGDVVEPGSTVSLSVSAGALVAVPDALGLSYEEAVSRIEARKLVAHLKDRRHNAGVKAGRIVSQSPESGSEVAAGTTVHVVKSLGPAPRRSSARSGSGCAGDCSRCHPGR